MNIKILGGGCSSCKKLYENTKKAVTETEINADVEFITVMQKIMEYPKPQAFLTSSRTGERREQKNCPFSFLPNGHQDFS